MHRRSKHGIGRGSAAKNSRNQPSVILITHQTAQRYAAARFLFVAQLLLIAFEVEAVEQMSGFMGSPDRLQRTFTASSQDFWAARYVNPLQFDITGERPGTRIPEPPNAIVIRPSTPDSRHPEIKTTVKQLLRRNRQPTSVKKACRDVGPIWGPYGNKLVLLLSCSTKLQTRRASKLSTP